MRALCFIVSSNQKETPPRQKTERSRSESRGHWGLSFVPTPAGFMDSRRPNCRENQSKMKQGIMMRTMEDYGREGEVQREAGATEGRGVRRWQITTTGTRKSTSIFHSLSSISSPSLRPFFFFLLFFYYILHFPLLFSSFHFLPQVLSPSAALPSNLRCLATAQTAA